LANIQQTVLQTAIDGMAARGTPYKGVLYAGLMLTNDGPKVLEFNCRFGDPETQVIIPLLASDLVEIMLACVEERLVDSAVQLHPGACATVVMASEGYPGRYPKGREITGIEAAESLDGVSVFHAGTALEDGRFVTNGGRVLAVSATGPTLPTALQQAYKAVDLIHFEGAHYRRDIG
jgi:phosphoribosylamine--glycine ligase